MTDEIVQPKKVNSLDDLDKSKPGERVFAIVIHEGRKGDYMFFEGKIDDKYSFLDPSSKMLGTSINCYRNTAEELEFNKGQVVIKRGDSQMYTIEEPEEYNKRRKLMGLEEYPI